MGPQYDPDIAITTLARVPGADDADESGSGTAEAEA
jgi:hypothetical protein